MLVSLVDSGDIVLAKIAHPPYRASVSRYSTMLAGVSAKYRDTGPSSQVNASAPTKYSTILPVIVPAVAMSA